MQRSARIPIRSNGFGTRSKSKRQDGIKNSYVKLLFLRHSKILKSILQRSFRMIRFSNLAQ
ncbi:hypothetical protein D1609_13515 [Leptospira borgpetersenii serovar Hardjo-bovis]|nr:hypothetical protein D1609_13515 [Leptospira borgpetersenii serovar Hardjo-bovis]TQE51883.1 hypothetical protein FFZ96_17150 [Leptospira borgpetersenii]